MADGTYLMNVFARRLHRSNAQNTLEEAEDMLRYFRDTILVLAAAPGPTNEEERHEVRCRVDEIWDELRESIIRAFKAQYVLDNPEDVIDELCNEDNGKEIWGDK